MSTYGARKNLLMMHVGLFFCLLLDKHLPKVVEGVIPSH